MSGTRSRVAARLAKVASSVAAVGVSMNALAATGAGFSAARLNREGNRLYGEKKFDEALDRYTRAQGSSTELAPLRYNVGNVFYRQGRFTEAEAEYRGVAGAAKGTLAATAAYNLGNALFNLQKYDQAAEAFKQAILSNPGDRDAKRNLELSLLKLRQQQQPRQQQQGGSERPEKEQDQQRRQTQQPESKPDGSGGDEKKDRKPGEAPSASNAEPAGRPDAGQDSAGQQEGDRTRAGARFSERQAEKLLEALAGDETRALRRLMRTRRAGAREAGEDW
ncbi:MAG: tetratricopeptide repeat protein [Thermoanaerobaculia bacterium]